MMFCRGFDFSTTTREVRVTYNTLNTYQEKKREERERERKREKTSETKRATTTAFTLLFRCCWCCCCFLLLRGGGALSEEQRKREVVLCKPTIQKIIIAEQKRSLSSPRGTKSCARTCGEGVSASSLRRFA